jgi:hypothetical protein
MLRARNFPYINVALIAVNFAVWIFYELPNSETAVGRWAFNP